MAAAMGDHLASLQLDPQLAAEYPGISHDTLFEAGYIHIGDKETCDKVGCNGRVVTRRRLGVDNPAPAVHFGLIASGDPVMRSAKDRDEISDKEGVVAFEMEGAGIWDTFPCVLIKGACDYADSHKNKSWQLYAAATAASCMKAFLSFWVPSPTLRQVQVLSGHEISAPRC
jgi:nucleoside phosphorylase